MFIHNISTRTITLHDTGGNLYTVPALSDLEVAEALWTDNEFRRWVRYRVRDIVISPTVVTASTSPHYVVTQDSGGLLTNQEVFSNLVGKGLAASRPGAAVPGKLYFSTDSGRLSRDNGSTWDNLDPDWSIIANKPASFTPSAHASSHAAGGSDALTGNLNATARVNVMLNGTTIGTRRAVNFLGGYTITDDSANEKVDVTPPPSVGMGMLIAMS